MWKRIRQYSRWVLQTCWLRREAAEGDNDRRRRNDVGGECSTAVDCGARYRPRSGATKSFSMRLAKEKRTIKTARAESSWRKLDLASSPKKGSNDDWTHPHDPGCAHHQDEGWAHPSWLTRPSIKRWIWRPERSSPSRCTGQMLETLQRIPETVAEAGERITTGVVADAHGDG